MSLWIHNSHFISSFTLSLSLSFSQKCLSCNKFWNRLWLFHAVVCGCLLNPIYLWHDLIMKTLCWVLKTRVGCGSLLPSLYHDPMVLHSLWCLFYEIRSTNIWYIHNSICYIFLINCYTYYCITAFCMFSLVWFWF